MLSGKGQFLFQSQRRAMSKNVQTTAQFAFISHDSKVMLKILQARLQMYENFQMYNLDLEEAEESEIKCQHPSHHRKRKGIIEKHLLLLC